MAGQLKESFSKMVNAVKADTEITFSPELSWWRKRQQRKKAVTYGRELWRREREEELTKDEFDKLWNEAQTDKGYNGFDILHGYWNEQRKNP